MTDYEKEIQVMQNVTKEEYLASLRRYFIIFPTVRISKRMITAEHSKTFLVAGRAAASQEAYPSTEELRGMYLLVAYAN